MTRQGKEEWGEPTFEYGLHDSRLTLARRRLSKSGMENWDQPKPGQVRRGTSAPSLGYSQSLVAPICPANLSIPLTSLPSPFLSLSDNRAQLSGRGFLSQNTPAELILGPLLAG
jgi:hypothetical protein